MSTTSHLAKILSGRTDPLTRRWELADDWSRVLERHRDVGLAGRFRVAPRADQVAAAVPQIEQLVTLLHSTHRVTVSGEAMAAHLLRDGTGPLYSPVSRRSLRVALDECLRSLTNAAELDDELPMTHTAGRRH